MSGANEVETLRARVAELEGVLEFYAQRQIEYAPSVGAMRRVGRVYYNSPMQRDMVGWPPRLLTQCPRPPLCTCALLFS